MSQFEVIYFAASCDTAEKNKAFAEKLKLNYPILSDTGKETASAYGVVDSTRVFPQRWTFFIDPEGKISAIVKKVKAPAHGKEIVAKLKQLKVPKVK